MVVRRDIFNAFIGYNCAKLNRVVSELYIFQHLSFTLCPLKTSEPSIFFQDSCQVVRSRRNRPLRAVPSDETMIIGFTIFGLPDVYRFTIQHVGRLICQTILATQSCFARIATEFIFTVTARIIVDAFNLLNLETAGRRGYII